MGTYTLVLKNDKEFNKKIGSKEDIIFPEGYYTYTGSVPNDNFSRIERHKNVCTGKNETEHWHIDYILHSSTITIKKVFKTRKDQECKVNNYINEDEFHDIGASDCTNCTSHVKYSENVNELIDNLENIYTN